MKNSLLLFLGILFLILGAWLVLQPSTEDSLNNVSSLPIKFSNNDPAEISQPESTIHRDGPAAKPILDSSQQLLFPVRFRGAVGTTISAG